MKDILTIFRKEVNHLFKDRRTVFNILVMPMIIFIMIFGLMGMFMNSKEEELQKTLYRIYTNNSGILGQILTDSSYDTYLFEEKDYDIEKSLTDKNIHAAVIFDGNLNSFDDYLTSNSPSIKLYSYSGSMASERIASSISYLMRESRDVYLNKIIAEKGIDTAIMQKPTIEMHNVATEKQKNAQNNFLIMMLPYLLALYLVQASFGIGFDTTAGEKERQTLTILLTNQVARTSIVWGKILFIMLMNVLSAVTSVIGLTIGATVMMGGNSSDMLAAFTPQTVLFLFLVVISMSVLIASIIAMIGIFSKSVKEATALGMPLMIIVILVGIISMQPEAFETMRWLLYVPLVNGIVHIKELFTNPQISYMTLGLSVIINFVFAGIFTLITARMFGDEKYIFRTEN